MSSTIIDGETGKEYVLAVPRCEKCGEYKSRFTISPGGWVYGSQTIPDKEVWGCACDFNFNNVSEEGAALVSIECTRL